MCVLGYKTKCISYCGSCSKFENCCWHTKQGVTTAMVKSVGKREDYQQEHCINRSGEWLWGAREEKGKANTTPRQQQHSVDTEAENWAWASPHSISPGLPLHTCLPPCPPPNLFVSTRRASFQQTVTIQGGKLNDFFSPLYYLNTLDCTLYTVNAQIFIE